MRNALKPSYQDRILGPRIVAAATSRMALPFTWLFLRLGLNPNGVTVLSALASAAGALVLATEAFPFAAAAGGALLMLGHLWDHCDGQVARARGLRSVEGGLLDAIVDRWAEAAWAAALTLAALARPGHAAFAGEPWQVGLCGLALLHGLTYFRWSSNTQSFAVLRATMARIGRRVGDMVRYEVPAQDSTAARGTPRYLGLPFLFERDVVMWSLFAVTLMPAWDAGMAALGAVLTLRGLEMNWYAIRKLRRGEDNFALVLNPDYH